MALDSLSDLLPRPIHRRPNRNCQCADYKSKGKRDRYFKEIDNCHFHTDEYEDDRQTQLEIDKSIDNIRQQEIERSESQNCEDIRCEDNERIARDGKDRRNGIDGENHIGRFDSHQRQQQRRCEQLPVLPNEKLVAAETVGYWKNPPCQLDEDIFHRIGRLMFLKHQFDTGEDQDRAEEVDRPVELFDKGASGEDEDDPHHQRAENPPEQDAVLELGFDRERGKDDHEDEDIIDGEGFFDQVAGDELDRLFRTEPDVDEPGETERQRNPDNAPDCGFFQGDDVGFAIEDAEVERQHHEHESEEPEPHCRSSDSFYAEKSHLFYC